MTIKIKEKKTKENEMIFDSINLLIDYIET